MLNRHLSTLIESNKMVGGRISFDQGFAMFKRLSKEELENVPEQERAYATNNMGRAVFQLTEDGKIIHYKGVDSHLDNSEIGLVGKVGAIPITYTKNIENPTEACYPLNLVLFLGKDGKPSADIRYRGGIPLEDTEIEAHLNLLMQDLGIKLPEILDIQEFSEDFLEKYGLPQYVEGSFEDFNSDYESEDIARKSCLKGMYGEHYREQTIQGKRPEKLAETLKRIGIDQDPRVQEFLKQHNLTIKDFSDYVDSVYSRGQRYGQMIRKMESPFRIADFEVLLGDEKNLPAIEAMVDFTEEMHPDRIPFENYFAKIMGQNLGNMMNNGWECENFSHRQDYSITGEMCDDSYVYAPKELEKCDKLEELGQIEFSAASNEEEIEDANDLMGKAKAGRSSIRLKYFTQIYSLASNVKILQEEMKMRGKSKEEIDSVLTDFLDSFNNTVNLEQVSLRVSDKTDIAKDAIQLLVRTPKNMAKLLAFDPSGPDRSDINEEVLLTQKSFNGFFDEVSQGLAERLGLERSFINETKKDVQGINPYEDFGRD